MTTEDIQIKIFLAKAKSETLAYVQVIFPIEVDGVGVLLKISNFRIMTSHFGNQSFKVMPPAIRSTGGKYRDVFFLDNKELWYRLERKILEEYKERVKTDVFNDQSSES